MVRRPDASPYLRKEGMLVLSTAQVTALLDPTILAANVAHAQRLAATQRLDRTHDRLFCTTGSGSETCACAGCGGHTGSDLTGTRGMPPVTPSQIRAAIRSAFELDRPRTGLAAARSPSCGDCRGPSTACRSNRSDPSCHQHRADQVPARPTRPSSHGTWRTARRPGLGPSAHHLDRNLLSFRNWVIPAKPRAAAGIRLAARGIGRVPPEAEQ